MCARLFLPVSAEELAEFLEIAGLPELEPRYNIAPGQDLLAVRSGPGGGRRASFLRWGLVPSFAQDPKIGHRLINARSETAGTRGVFRESLRMRRCLVPAAGFYEWKSVGSAKQPYAVKPRAGLLAIGGLWDAWERDGRRLETCTLLTTTPNELIAPIHDRMPVLLDRERFAEWLDPRQQDPRGLAALMQPYPAERLLAHPVSTRVNRPTVDDPACLAPAAVEVPAQGRLF
jgi:putative SOS response-associated peptidase YedK